MHRISIVVAAEASGIESVFLLYRSLKDCLFGFDIHFNLLLYNVCGRSALFSEHVKSKEPSINIFQSEDKPLPIVTSRNICQNRLLQCLNEFGGVGMVLDDDLIWTASNHQFASLLKNLHSKKIDMAFLGMDGDPPVPREYVRAEPLMDLLLAIRHAGFLVSEIDALLLELELDKSDHEPKNYDNAYYSKRLRASKHQVQLEGFDFLEFLSSIYIGKATTRPSFVVSEISPANGLERGGATLFLNNKVLEIENFAFFGAGVVSRKSDVLMAVEAFKKGFSLCLTPPVLLHCRQAAFDFSHSNKLVSDVFAYALVVASHHGFSWGSFRQALDVHFTSSCEQLVQVNKMITILEQYLSLCSTNKSLLVVEEERQLIQKIYWENESALEHLKEFSLRIDHDQEFLTALSLAEKGLFPSNFSKH